jgi:hypothetical protein
MNYASTRERLREFVDLLPDGANCFRYFGT